MSWVLEADKYEIVARMALGMASPLGRQTDEATSLPTPELRREPSDYEIYHGDMSNHQNCKFRQYNSVSMCS